MIVVERNVSQEDSLLPICLLARVAPRLNASVLRQHLFFKMRCQMYRHLILGSVRIMTDRAAEVKLVAGVGDILEKHWEVFGCHKIFDLIMDDC